MLKRYSPNHTFAYSLLRAHLRAILHSMKGEVDLRDLLLVLDRAQRIVNVLILGGRTVHAGQLELPVVVRKISFAAEAMSRSS